MPAGNQTSGELPRLTNEGELAAMKVEMLGWVAIYVLERHVILEERIPPDREMHAAREVLLWLRGELSLKPGDHAITFGDHPAPVVYLCCRARPVVVDRMEGRRRRVQQRRISAARRLGQSAEDPHQWQESHDHHETEDHVE